jgi:hypothetical protein
MDVTPFQSPNYTQTPNDFFDMLPNMEYSEMAVTLVMIRQTFGYHRIGFRMGINKLADLTGLSRNAVKDGAEAAEKRGTFMRSNPDSLEEAEWELVILEGGQPVTTSPSDQVDGQPVTTGWSLVDSQVGVKEIINKEKDRGRPTPDFSQMTVTEARKRPTIRLYTEATGFFPGSVIWEFVDGYITHNKLTAEKIKAAAVAWSLRGYKQENVIGILEWAANGIPANGKTQESYRRPLPTVEELFKDEDKKKYVPPPPGNREKVHEAIAKATAKLQSDSLREAKK